MILSSEYMLTDKDGILSETAKQANNVIKTRESYTSQTSFLDGEKPCK